MSETRLYVPDTYVNAAAGTSCCSPRLFFTLHQALGPDHGGRIGSLTLFFSLPPPLNCSHLDASLLNPGKYADVCTLEAGMRALNSDCHIRR